MTDLGLVGLVNKGTYSSSATYKAGNFVYYANSSWLCILDNTKNVTPNSTNTTNWQMLAQGFGLQNNATTTATGYALDARMGKTLADAIPPIKFTSIDYMSAGAHTFSLASNSRHVIFLSSTAVHGIAFFNCISDGNVYYFEAGGTFTDWSADTATANKIKFTNGTSGTIDVLIMTLRGAKPTEDE